jgi:hypothetical protein
MHKFFLLYLPCAIIGWCIGDLHLSFWNGLLLSIVGGAGWAVLYNWAFRLGPFSKD